VKYIKLGREIEFNKFVQVRKDEINKLSYLFL
jgi:hypothetical protein